MVDLPPLRWTWLRRLVVVFVVLRFAWGMATAGLPWYAALVGFAFGLTVVGAILYGVWTALDSARGKLPEVDAS